MKSSPIKIRNAAIGDAAILSAAQSEYGSPGGQRSQGDYRTSTLAVMRQIEAMRRKGLFLVAEVNRKIIGHALIAPMGADHNDHVCSLSLVVHQGFTRQRVGSALMDSILTWAEQTPSVEKIELLLCERNTAALRFFSKYGFSVEGRFERRIKYGFRNYAAEIVMGLLIKEAPYRPESD